MLADLLLAVACIANSVCFIIHLVSHHKKGKAVKFDFHPSEDDLRRASRLQDWHDRSDDVAARFHENCRNFFTTD